MSANMRRWLLVGMTGLAATAVVVMAGGVSDQQPDKRRVDAPVVTVPPAIHQAEPSIMVDAALRPVGLQQEPEDEPEAAPRGTRNTVRVHEPRILLRRESLLATDRPGVIATVVPTEGDYVEEGDLLVSLRAEEAQALLEVAKQEASTNVNKRFAEAQLRVSQAELDKALIANRKYPDAVSQVELDRLEFTRDRAELQIEQAIHEEELADLRVHEAQARVEASEIRAPFSGFVTEVEKSVGEAVRQGDPLLRICRTDVVKVEGYVSVAQAGRLKRGMPVEVFLDSAEVYEPDPHRGTLHSVDVKVDPVNQLVRVWAEVPNPNNVLRAGLFARMYIELPEGAPPAPADEPPPGKPTI
jgi:RND family efflux transporter MFP subunit